MTGKLNNAQNRASINLKK